MKLLAPSFSSTGRQYHS